MHFISLHDQQCEKVLVTNLHRHMLLLLAILSNLLYRMRFSFGDYKIW